MSNYDEGLDDGQELDVSEDQEIIEEDNGEAVVTQQPVELTREEKEKIALQYLHENQYLQPQAPTAAPIYAEDETEVDLDEIIRDPKKFRQHTVADGAALAERNLIKRMQLQEHAVADIRRENPDVPEEVVAKIRAAFMEPNIPVTALEGQVRGGAHINLANAYMWDAFKKGKYTPRAATGSGEPVGGATSANVSKVSQIQADYKRMTGRELDRKEAEKLAKQGSY